MRKIMIAALAATMLCAAANAAAFSFAVAGGVTGTGTLTTTSDTPTNGAYTITGVSGTLNGETLTGVLPTGTIGGNDNLLYLSNAIQLDAAGLGLATASDIYNLFYFAPLATYGLFNNDRSISVRVTFLASQPTSGVPEPASWMMMISGFGLIGAAMRRRKVAVRFA